MIVELTSTKGNALTLDINTGKIDCALGSIQLNGTATHNVDGSNVFCLETDKGVIALDDNSRDAYMTAKKAAHKALVNKMVPGLDKLQAAQIEINRYFEQSNKMMEDEQNDGVFAPKKPNADYDALAAQYPVAAVYMRADSYHDASNYKKSAAGKNAKKILLEGGSMEDAIAILQDWAK